MKLLTLAILLLSLFLYINNDSPFSTIFWKTPKEVYSTSDVKAPVLYGLAAEYFVKISSYWPISSVVHNMLKKDSRYDVVVNFASSLPGMGVAQPIVLPSQERIERDLRLKESQDEAVWLVEDVVKAGGFQFRTIMDYAKAYRSGESSPVIVAEAFVKNVKEAKYLNAFMALNESDLFEQAKASDQRFKEGKPLSVVDGVLITVKDEINVNGYRTWCGTKFMDLKFEEESTIIARLRAAGAIIAGKNTMHEVGMGITGHNAFWGIARNPYNLSHHTGGSSSGGGAAVASGIVPVAIGCDGGGSIRVPAGNCGVFGLKTSAGRVTHHGMCPLVQTVGQCGPIAATTRDAAIIYNIIAGPDPKDAISGFQPSVQINQFDSELSGLKVGVYWSYINDSSEEMSSAVKHLVNTLKAKGATIIDIEIPNLEVMQKSHSLTIVTEMITGLSYTFKDHFTDYSLDVQATMAFAFNKFTALDYISAQKVKEYSLEIFKDIYKSVDIIVLPNTGTVAAPVSKNVDFEGSEPEINSGVLSSVLRFASLANFVGIPSIALPISYNNDNLPISAQIMGQWWDEALLLNIAANIESFTERNSPTTHFKSL